MKKNFKREKISNMKVFSASFTFHDELLFYLIWQMNHDCVWRENCVISADGIMKNGSVIFVYDEISNGAIFLDFHKSNTTHHYISRY